MDIEAIKEALDILTEDQIKAVSDVLEKIKKKHAVQKRKETEKAYDRAIGVLGNR